MLRRIAVVAAAGVLAAACATTRAAVPIERPALDVPPAPPRIVEPAPLPDLGNPEPVADLPPEKPAPPAVRPRPAPRETAGKEPQKPESKPAETLPPAGDPAVGAPQQAASAPPLIRTPATADTAAAARQIRDTLARAQKSLKDINPQRLNEDRRRAYGQALDFIASAEARVRSSDFELAKEFAEKAEKLAGELVGR